MEISNDAAKAAEKLADLNTNGSLLEQKLEELRLWDEKVANLIEKDEDFDQEFIDSGDYNRTIVKVLVGIKEVVTPTILFAIKLPRTTIMEMETVMMVMMAIMQR